MSANQTSFAAQAERIRLRLSSMKTSATQVGERLFSPPPAASRPERGVHFTPPRDSSSGGVPDDLAGGSGEYSSISVYAGGGAGELSLFRFTPELQSSLCQGVVSKGLKFCLLGAQACPHKSHQKKATLFVDHLYVAADAKSAFINHHIPSSVLSGNQLNLILNERHTKEEWVRLLHAWNSQAQEDLKPDVYSRVGALMVSTAVTPSRKKRPIYAVEEEDLSDTVPGLLAASSSLSESLSGSFEFEFIPPVPEGGDESMGSDDKLADMLQKWDLLVGNVNKISEAFKHIRRSFGNDVDSLQDKISIVDCRVGNIPRNTTGLEDCLTAWEGISFIHQGISELTANMSNLSDKVNDFEKLSMESKRSNSQTQELFFQMKKSMSDMEAVLSALGEEHEFIMNKVQGGPLTTASSAVVNDSIQRLGARLQACEAQLASATFGSSGSSETLVSEINSVKAELRRLDARVPKINNMMLGGQVFQSKADVDLFISKSVPTNAFYLFHDAVTILESLSGAFQERKEVLSEWYQSSRVGCSAQEARHIASFRTTLPHVFGYCKDGVVSAKHKLPAVKKYEDWTTFDQDSGVMNFILRGIDDLKIQITNEIHSTLGDEFPEAVKLATEMHTASHYFICQLCTFVTDFVQEMSSTAESPIEEAWELVSACVRKVFDELRRVRAAASNAMAEQNPLTKCGLILWCLIQSNRVQKEYLDTRFRNHPTIAPVIILHVFRTRVTKLAFKEGLKRLEGRIAQLEKKPAGQGGKGNNNNANNANNGGKQPDEKK